MEDHFNLIANKLKIFMKSGHDFIFDNRKNMSRRNPIEILKRLQREAFADLMKLRDRQDKVEKMLTFYKTLKGGPFQEDGTHVRGAVDVMGNLFLMDHMDQDKIEAIKRAGIRTGVDARITFETRVRHTDILEAEFNSSQGSHQDSSNGLGNSLSLSRVSYKANMTDWLSVVAIPMGSRCRDMTVSTDSLQEKGLTEYSSFGPPLLHQSPGSGIGLIVKKSNIVASLAQFVVDLPGSFSHCFSTFGQIVYSLPKGAKLSLFGLHKVPKSRQQASLGALTIPLGFWRRRKPPEASAETSFLTLGTNSNEITSVGSVAVMLESELDESTRVRGWVEMRNNNPSHLKWSVGMSDFPEDEIGWGLSLGGTIQGPKRWDHFQVEAFLRFNLSNRVSVQPAFVYLMDGNNQMPALMFRSSWSL